MQQLHMIGKLLCVILDTPMAQRSIVLFHLEFLSSIYSGHYNFKLPACLLSVNSMKS
jgi:hypothetical protein